MERKLPAQPEPTQKHRQDAKFALAFHLEDFETEQWALALECCAWALAKQEREREE